MAAPNVNNRNKAFLPWRSIKSMASWTYIYSSSRQRSLIPNSPCYYVSHVYILYTLRLYHLIPRHVHHHNRAYVPSPDRLFFNLRSALPDLRQLSRFSCTLLDQIPMYWLSQRGYTTAGFSKLDLPLLPPLTLSENLYPL